jgi:hypothetical protein
MIKEVMAEKVALIPGTEKHLKYIPIPETIHINKIFGWVDRNDTKGTIYLGRWAGEYYHGIPMTNPLHQLAVIYISYKYDDCE